MLSNTPLYSGSVLMPTRRRFVQGLAAGGLLAGSDIWARYAFAQGNKAVSGLAPVLRGTEFDLVITEAAVNFTGTPGIATVINGSLPAPTLRWREGDTVTLRVTNRLKEDTSIHWHGIILPFQMDGVPGVSFAGIKPGATFTYRFKVAQNGTYWYHSHSGMQELTGLYGAIIIDPCDASTQPRCERDYVVQLSDWTDEDPMRVFMNLRKLGNYYNHNQPTAQQFAQDVARYGIKAALDMRKMWNEMRMSPTDLADISSVALTYLMNGKTPAGNWTGIFKRGEKVRLRFINGAAHTFYDVRIPGLPMQMISADGVAIETVTVDEFRMGPGETFDAIVTPVEDAHSIFAQTMDRTGYARGTLAVAAGLSAPVPIVDKAEWLSMTDMMGNMHGMGHHAMPNMNHSAMTMDHSAMDHSTMAMPKAANPLAKASTKVRHAHTEYGPSTDMRVDTPRTNLDDPGIGLRNNGRRVLTLADLHSIGGPLDARRAEREIELHLTGNMERYTWSLDGLEFGKATPIRMNYGERLRVILHNDTMMTHPMHLHGLWQELETPEGQFQARKHTIPVQPAQRISFLLTAEPRGRWVWHCHLMLHMEMGMFREVVIA